jgi:hypothetical protein
MKHFKIQEFVPQEIYEKYGDYCIYKIDDKILTVADSIREYFNQPMTINNWSSGGQFSYRGYRPDNYENKASKSAHYFGKAIDFDIQGYEPEEIRQEIIKNYKKFPFITRMEHIDTKTGKPINWVHIDTMPTGRTDIVLFNV